jgi:hypothetical protein
MKRGARAKSRDNGGNPEQGVQNKGQVNYFGIQGVQSKGQVNYFGIQGRLGALRITDLSPFSQPNQSRKI